MAYKRIIPCLDVHNGRVVKGVNFTNIQDAGDPLALATYYEEAGADELVLLDISASVEGRGHTLKVVKNIAQKLTIPLTVGGGIKTIADIQRVLEAGADKVSFCSPAVQNPQLVAQAAQKFGSKHIVVAIDARKGQEGGWEAYIHGGRTPTGLDVVAWAKEVESLGAGEILLTSMDRDGTKDGYDLELTAAVSSAVQIPVIASGGAGNLRHLLEGLTIGKAQGVLAASIFHYGEYTIREAKEYLAENGVLIRP